ncbi:PREDICTED: uncharacterized protein LOC101818012 [Ficedula albicollis]|uniref:uncharacterized protein LOC101818012 n=1 Tax=Ficedula albicollis TaxID=59894 RepID=UPI0007AD7DF5|nr:PREDICTED: uncharacterized protein LOC101818012 [Ficedula albicollis]
MGNLEKLVYDSSNILERGGGAAGWKNEDVEDKKSLEASKLLDKMLGDLERRRVMKGKTLLKAEFPGGSSGSVSASAAGGEAMPVTGGEHSRKASPAAWLHEDLQSLEPPAGVSARRTFQGTLLVAPHKLGSHHRGLLRGSNKLKGDSKFLETSKDMDKMLGDLERRHEMDRKSLLKAALSGRSTGSVPAPGTRREEMPDSATEDVITETGIYAQDPVHLPRIVCPQDVRRSCMIGTVVTIFTAPVVLVCGYFGIRKLYEMRRMIKPTLV